MLKIIEHLKKFIRRDNRIFLGRWKNEDPLKTDKKIDLSNYDHCGPCGKKILINNEKFNKKTDSNKLDNNNDINFI